MNWLRWPRKVAPLRGAVSELVAISPRIPAMPKLRKEEHTEKTKQVYSSHKAMAGASDIYSGPQIMMQHEINRAVRHSQIGKIALK